jgi:hypothetical protein
MRRFFLEKNMGVIDKVLRFVLALVVAVIIATRVLEGTLALVLGILAAIFLLTNFVGFVHYTGLSGH